MIKLKLIALMLIVVTVTGTLAEKPAVSKSKPNVIVLFTDDHGYADIGVHGMRKDVKTPHLDAMAKDGVTCTSGYITSPQCSPSRAGLITGRYQQSFGFDTIPDCPLRLERVTIAERLKKAGYTTGMVGKWHLELNHTCIKWAQENKPTAVVRRGNQMVAKLDAQTVMKFFPEHQGFDQFFKGEINRYWANYDLDGRDLEKGGEWLTPKGYRIDLQTQAALSFIERNQDDPFFLFLGYFAPHVPLEATEKYLKRFSSDMPVRRRYALAMISAVDDGVGDIRKKLGELNLLDNTIIFFISDNGAPLKIDMKDIPISFKGGAWDGSRNDPWIGEKGTLMEGGIRVPYLVSWPAVLPKGLVYKEPVISVDVAATALAAAGESIPDILDGEDLVPRLTGKIKDDRSLYWRFWKQSAVRRGKWKYLAAADGREWLFDLESDQHEKMNLLKQNPEKAQELKRSLRGWCDTLQPAGMPKGIMNGQELKWFDHYLK